MRRVIDWILADKDRTKVQEALKRAGEPASAEVQSALSMAKNELLSPAAIRARSKLSGGGCDRRRVGGIRAGAARSNAMGLRRPARVRGSASSRHPHRLGWVRSRWPWLLVDEFQDVNRAQAELVWLLAAGEGNVAIVADEDQVVQVSVARIPCTSPASPRATRRTARSCSGATSAAAQRSSRRLRGASRTTSKGLLSIVAVRGAGGQVRVRSFYEDWHEAHWIAEQVAEAIAADFQRRRSLFWRAPATRLRPRSSRSPGQGSRTGSYTSGDQRVPGLECDRRNISSSAERWKEIAGMLQGNLDKVVHHGKRADSSSRTCCCIRARAHKEHRPVDINAVVEESLNLAYHGARAEKQGFNITLERSFDPTAGEVDVYPQEITRVLLKPNLKRLLRGDEAQSGKANGGDL